MSYLNRKIIQQMWLDGTLILQMPEKGSVSHSYLVHMLETVAMGTYDYHDGKETYAKRQSGEAINYDPDAIGRFWTGNWRTLCDKMMVAPSDSERLRIYRSWRILCRSGLALRLCKPIPYKSRNNWRYAYLITIGGRDETAYLRNRIADDDESWRILPYDE